MQPFHYNPWHVYRYPRWHQYLIWLMENYTSARVIGFFVAWAIMLSPVVALLAIFSPVVQNCMLRWLG